MGGGDIRSHRKFLLFSDLIICFLAGLISVAFNHGVSFLVSNFGTICLELLVFTGCYLAGFIVWRTYESFHRNVVTEDYIYSIAGLVTGGILSAGCIYVGLFGSLFDYHDLILQGFFSFVGIRAFRRFVVLHYQFYRRRSDTNGSYGLSDMALLNMEFSDLLTRAPLSIDEESIKQGIVGKRILVTGGAGSIGSELVKKIASNNPELIILVDQAETPLHDLEIELARLFPTQKIKSVLTDISNVSIIEKIFIENRPDMVFHAAAYKHVGMMERNVVECVLNNIKGTVILADLAVKHHCSKFVMISTDKAVNPSSVMGCSKRINEIYCQSMATDNSLKTDCAFITTRFGNVLGSNGSVITVFRNQIRHGGPITLTHPDVIRYFMLIPEACNLVLEASALGKGGEIFVFDMGSPVKIKDLAEKMIQISGRRDINIEYIGLNPGEKLYEEVLADKEKVKATVNEKIWVADVIKYEYKYVKEKIEELIATAEKADENRLRIIMHEIVPEFKEFSS